MPFIRHNKNCPTLQKPLLNRQTNKIVEKEKIVEVPVEKIVEKIVEVPVEKIVEVPVEKIVEKMSEPSISESQFDEIVQVARQKDDDYKQVISIRDQIIDHLEKQLKEKEELLNKTHVTIATIEQRINDIPLESQKKKSRIEELAMPKKRH